MYYKNLLSALPCDRCKNRSICFLQRIQLQHYPESTQKFVIELPSRIFSYNASKRYWRVTNYREIQKRLVWYYDFYECHIPENYQAVLTPQAQRDSDKSLILSEFKKLLEVAARATENTAPEMSIMFDGIGLVLASDYLEAIHKILSMLKTGEKYQGRFGVNCTQYSD